MDERVLVVGCGLIGGSIGLALRGAGVHVCGVDTSAATADMALRMGAVDAIESDPAAAASAVGVVIVATPVGEIVPTTRALAASLPEGAVVTDVGSAKRHIVAEAESLMPAGRHFVGGHPMAGSEREGVEAARSDLFDGALWILTPTEATDDAAYRRVHRLVQAARARTLAMEPAEHDELVALVSHLPYALATTLMDLAATQGDDRTFAAAAGSFRDVTRTAGSNPAVWRDILSANRDAVLGQLDAFAAALHTLRDALASQDWAAVEKAIHRAREGRRRLPLKGAHGPVLPVTIEVPVPDRAGVLAAITTAFGQRGINIEDLRVDHSGAGGLVSVVVDKKDADAAAAMLRDRGYRAIVTEA